MSRAAFGRALVLLSITRAPLSFADEVAEPAGFGNPTAGKVSDEMQATDEAPGGAYDRLEGDLDLAVGVGAELAGDVLGAARLSAHYYSVAGLYVAYADGFGRADLARRLSFGVDVRPAFVARWAKNYEQGPAFLDLFVDSISLGLGAFYAQPRDGSFGDDRGFEASLGFGLPLFGHASGLWLESRGTLRWVENESARPAAYVGLAWHGFVLSPLARREIDIARE